MSRVFSNLASSNTNPQLQELQRELSPMLSAHYDKISLNEELFKRVEAVWQEKDAIELTSEQRKLLNDTRKQFVRSGALMNEEEKKQITEINSKISGLSTSFGQNLLAETNGFELILEKSDLDGLSEGTIAAASDAASQKMEKAETKDVDNPDILELISVICFFSSSLISAPLRTNCFLVSFKSLRCSLVRSIASLSCHIASTRLNNFSFNEILS